VVNYKVTGDWMVGNKNIQGKISKSLMFMLMKFYSNIDKSQLYELLKKNDEFITVEGDNNSTIINMWYDPLDGSSNRRERFCELFQSIKNNSTRNSCDYG
jgi:fructose-1,6-bisphosphatase